MGIFDFLKNLASHDESDRTLKEEDFRAVGVYYYEKNIKKLACKNPDWSLTAAQVIGAGKAGRKIFKNNYINKPVKLILEPNNPNDRNAVAVVFAGELVGYISHEENRHVREILQRHDVKSISGFIGGGEYKIISDDGKTMKAGHSFTVTVRIKYV